MKIGIDNYSYHRYFGEIYEGQQDPGYCWGLADCLQHIRKEHPDIEAISLETCFITGEERKELPRLLKDIQCEVVFAWGHPNGFMGVDMEEALAEIHDYLKISSSRGQDRMRIAASSLAYRTADRASQISAAVQAINRILPMAKEYRVQLALENHGDFSLPEMLAILELVHSDYLGVTFDTGNALRLHEDCCRSIKAYGERVLLVHAKDVALEASVPTGGLAPVNCVPAGQGLVDFGGLFDALAAIRYEGMVLIEISRLHSSLGNREETGILQEGIRYLKGIRREM